MKIDLTNSVHVFGATLDGEARGCGAPGMRHVASTVLARVHHPLWWGHDVVSVCRARLQYSCWNQDDPNYQHLLNLTTEDPSFALALEIAAQAIAGNLPDDTNGADSYYALSMRRPPFWATSAVHTFSDGWHWFGRTRAENTPNLSIVHACLVAPNDDAATDALNQAELNRVQSA